MILQVFLKFLGWPGCSWSRRATMRPGGASRLCRCLWRGFYHGIGFVFGSHGGIL